MIREESLEVGENYDRKIIGKDVWFVIEVLKC